jgi:hypothetical protein
MLVRRLTLGLLLLGGALMATPAASQDLDYWQLLALDRAVFRIDQIAWLPEGPTEGQDLVVGDRYGFVRVLRVTGNEVREVWRSPSLAGAVMEVMVEDLDGDGPVEIIARSRGGRIYVYDDLFKPLWENLSEDYSEIQCMAIANMDSDVPYEIVLLNDRGFLDYVDGDLFNREFRSTQTYRASDMAIGNVDTDPDLEIVLNTGQVIDAVIGEPQWNTDAFGERIELLDIDGDGVEEVLGYTINQILRVFDVDEQQEKPLR